MSVESDLFNVLRSLAADRVYRDLAPDDVSALPRITFQQIGGDAVNFIDPTVPSKKNARMQVNAWAASRDSAAALGRQIEDTLRLASGLQTRVRQTSRERHSGRHRVRSRSIGLEVRVCDAPGDEPGASRMQERMHQSDTFDPA